MWAGAEIFWLLEMVKPRHSLKQFYFHCCGAAQMILEKGYSNLLTMLYSRKAAK